MKSRVLSSIALVVFLCSAVLSGFAEDITNEVQNLHRETRGMKQIAKTAETSKEKAVAAKFQTGVTYEDVLKDPNNIALNVRYAQDQIARGEVLGAAATLERILLMNPKLPDVRLLYAVVLYRLDSLDEAQRELDTLRNVTLPPEFLCRGYHQRNAELAR